MNQQIRGKTGKQENKGKQDFLRKSSNGYFKSNALSLEEIILRFLRVFQILVDPLALFIYL